MPDFLAEVLTWPENYGAALAIETALNLNMPPTDFISFTNDSGGKWSGLDKKLAVAFTIMGKELCPNCGSPTWICRNSDNNIDFSVRKGTCHGKAALDKNQAQATKRGVKPKPGEFQYVVPMQVNGQEIPKGTRAQYYQDESEN